jgi:hypothetical protein
MRPESGPPRLNLRDGTRGPRPAHLSLLAQRSPSSAQRHGKGVLRLFRVLEAPWSGSAGPIYMNCARPKPAPATPSMGRESVIHANADLVEGVTEAEAEAPPEGFARYACLVPLLSRMMMMIVMIMMMIMMIDPRGYIIYGPALPPRHKGSGREFALSSGLHGLPRLAGKPGAACRRMWPPSPLATKGR